MKRDEGSKNLSRIHRRASGKGAAFGEAHYGPWGTCGPRVQTDFQFVAIQRGSAQVWIDGISHVIAAGQCLVLCPDRVEHLLFARSEPTHHTWCAVAPEVVGPDLQARLRALGTPVAVTSRLLTLMETAFTLSEASDRDVDTASNLLNALGLSVLWAYCHEVHMHQQVGAKDRVLDRARAFVEARYAHSLGISDIADHAGVSNQHLIRLFRKHLGTTPAAYLWQIRTLRGCELLRETGLSVAEIADRVGFRNAFHFTKRIRLAQGLGPRAYRQKCWGKALKEPS